MPSKLIIVKSAKIDLMEIYKYIAKNDSIERADDIYNNIKSKCLSLLETPEKGHIPAEFLFVGVREYLEVHYKKIRIIYQVNKNTVIVHCILDGRRNIRSILNDRLLRL